MSDKSTHHITITPHEGRVRVLFGGAVVAETTRALGLSEGAIPTVFYIPREDAAMGYFEATDHSTHCPYKGGASYFSLRVGGRVAENAVWSYERPLDAMSAIKGHLAFYPDRVEAIETTAV